MRAILPHDLPKEEIRRRMRERSHEIADFIPGGMAQVDTGWPSENRMTLAILAMGQQLSGQVDIEEKQLIIDLDLPPMLGFLEPVIQGAIRSQGQKLLTKD